MPTAKQTIDALKCITGFGDEHLDCNNCKYNCFEKGIVDDAVEALQKLIPQKPKKETSIRGTECSLCRSCNIVICASDTAIRCDFCPWCGQAIDWSGTE